MTRTTPIDKRLADPDADQVRRSHAQAIKELQAAPGVASRIVRNVELADATEVAVAHGLGRAPNHISVSAPRGAATAGIVRDFGTVSPATGAPIDRAQVVVLRADGYGATITVDVEFK